LPRRRYLLIAGAAVAAGGLVLLVTAAVFWQSYGRIIDAKLGGALQSMPRVYGRPFELAPGRGLSPAQFVQRLNDVGYTQRAEVDGPGEFSLSDTSVTVGTRPGTNAPGRTLTVEFSANRPVVTRIADAGGERVPRLALEPPLLAVLTPGEKRRYMPLSGIPQHQIDAVLAIEDRRFYDHPGVDIIRAAGALVTNLRGDRPYLVGGSTLTQQIVKNTFLTPEKTLKRKLQEQFMALVLESRLSKDQLLELYLNDVVLGQRGPFEIHGVAEAARVFFGKHLSNISLAEAATLAGIIQAPSSHNPFRNPERARDRRNLVLREMVSAGFIAEEEAAAAIETPLTVSERALENEAPYFVDYVRSILAERGVALGGDTAADVHTTLDLHLQRLAQQAIDEGLERIDARLAARTRDGQGQPQAALVAIDPRSGEILAVVGGRDYSRTQFNRAVAARRQPGSIFKPFVYLAAFERMAAEGRADITPATVVLDEPTIFKDGEDDYMPANYQNEYDGPITLRRALALSRNVVAIKVAEVTGYDQVANLWQRVGVGTPAKPFPSVALGVFEASPIEMAAAYTLFMNDGAVRPLRALSAITIEGRTERIEDQPLRPVARPDTTFLVTSMMRSVMNEGTGASARASFHLDAAGKSGTTNDLRDAWFVGFTPELLTIVWVGFDDNQPIGLGGSAAALPIWTSFMSAALAARPNLTFEPPEGVSFVDIDPETGMLATPRCPKVQREAFLTDTEPGYFCYLHGGGLWSRFGRTMRRYIRR
jgi:penicillin-binding protein 1B